MIRVRDWWMLTDVTKSVVIATRLYFQHIHNEVVQCTVAVLLFFADYKRVLLKKKYFDKYTGVQYWIIQITVTYNNTYVHFMQYFQIWHIFVRVVVRCAEKWRIEWRGRVVHVPTPLVRPFTVVRRAIC